jgi:hypothetical protein
VIYCALGGALILSLGFVAAGSSATFASKIAANPSTFHQTIVDRSNKGDRLATTTTIVQKTVRPMVRPITSAQPRGRLPDGCDPLVSPLAGSATAGLTGRCMS